MRNSAYEDELEKDHHLEVKDVSGFFSVGYSIRPTAKLEIIPNLGIGFGESDITFTVDTIPNGGGIKNYLDGQADTYRMTMVRTYARIGLKLTYEIEPVETSFNRSFYPVELGLNTEYQVGIDHSRWYRAGERETGGPNIFPTNFYVGFVMGWWL